MKTPIRVLIVEDSQDDAVLVLRELARGGFGPEAERVETAEALRGALARQPWDLIIADHSLPSFNSFEALSVLRDSGRDIPFIIVSGSIGEETAVEAMKAGADDYLLKSNLKRLVQAVRRELREARQRRERRAMEQALRQTYEKLRLFFQVSPLAIFSVDFSGTVQTWNRAAEATFGFTAHEVLGHAIPIVAAEQAAEFGALLRSHREGATLMGQEQAWRAKSGRAIDGAAWTGLLRDASGAPSSIMFTVADVTEAKRLEAQLRQAQKMEAVGRLAGGIAHDFNNLLLVVGGYCGLALEATRPGDPLRKHVEEIQQAAQRATSLVRQLLAFSRRQITQPRVLDLNAAVEGVETMLRRLIGEHIELHIACSARQGTVRFDPGQLEQVIMNLVINASDAMPGGGRIAIETANVEQSVEGGLPCPGLPAGSYVALAVRDNGCGMDAATRARLFEPFFTTKEAGKGTGLGLSTVLGIVQHHGGTILVDSEPGMGSTFTIFLPRVTEPLEADRLGPAADQAASLSGGETIFLVEDEPAVRALVGGTLRQSGFRVLEAADGAAAQAAFERDLPAVDLLITDMVLPRLGGRELARRLRQRRPEVRVLFTSGYADEFAGGLPQGEHFLEKPFTPLSLLRKVREVLDAEPASCATAAGSPNRGALPGSRPPAPRG